jgi:hypothetical protein
LIKNDKKLIYVVFIFYILFIITKIWNIQNAKRPRIDETPSTQTELPANYDVITNIGMPIIDKISVSVKYECVKIPVNNDHYLYMHTFLLQFKAMDWNYTLKICNPHKIDNAVDKWNNLSKGIIGTTLKYNTEIGEITIKICDDTSVDINIISDKVISSSMHFSIRYHYCRYAFAKIYQTIITEIHSNPM